MDFFLIFYLILCEKLMIKFLFNQVAIRKNLNYFDAAWSVTLIVLSFNIFDTVGKYLTAFRDYYNFKKVSIIILLRFLFFITYLSRVTSDDVPVINDDWFVFVNNGLFALLNGFATSCIFVLAPDVVRDHEKEKVGFILSSFLFLGILSGAMLAIPFKSL